MPLFIWLKGFFSFFFFPTCVPQSCPAVAGAWWAGKKRWGCACWSKASCCSLAAARTALGPWFAWSRLEGTLKIQGSTFLPSPCYAFKFLPVCLVFALHVKMLLGHVSGANVEYCRIPASAGRSPLEMSFASSDETLGLAGSSKGPRPQPLPWV